MFYDNGGRRKTYKPSHMQPPMIYNLESFMGQTLICLLHLQLRYSVWAVFWCIIPVS